MSTLQKLNSLHSKMRSCRACPQMCGTPVHGHAFESPILLVGQAPGATESDRGRPFAHTAGKTLFKWLGSATGLNEAELREQIYISAVARCFPGKAPSGSGDRAPNLQEIENCRPYLHGEVEALKPVLILPVGRVAIGQILGPDLFPKGTTLASVVGKKWKVKFNGHEAEAIPLPHPSGVSRWTQTEPGKTQLKKALGLIKRVAPGLLES